MSDPRRLIEHIGERAPFPNDAFERMLQRRDRKRRNERLIAAVVALVVIVAIIVLAAKELAPPTTVPASVPTATGTVYSFFAGGVRVAVNGVEIETTSTHPKFPPGTPTTELDMRYVIRPMIVVPAGAAVVIGPDVDRAWVDVHDLTEPAQRLYEIDLSAPPSLPESPGTYYLELYTLSPPSYIDGLTSLIPIRVVASEAS